MDGANGQTGGKNRSRSFVLTAFISFGLFNIFLLIHIKVITSVVWVHGSKC